MINNNNQQGFLSLDMAIGLMVLSIVITLATLWQFKQMDAQDYRIAADQQKTIAQAQVNYLKDNYANRTGTDHGTDADQHPLSTCRFQRHQCLWADDPWPCPQTKSQPTGSDCDHHRRATYSGNGHSHHS